ncbi:hypothetical protein PHLGIDRAFT_291471 [Phlebiopsis gigantea 11061_1 CR5-6]|uniref:Uncharacterized protein n=1 Tax=Phlebiopsis gigantea (strain 11061_1 CR5-6) TaxID=745531 RepID=A0A0C3RR85_PHLG1|nr:hypothetical protein PHLGIDRAFT_291471 [Phlebiopsis gigantea 11061_1 CR5-6]
MGKEHAMIIKNAPNIHTLWATVQAHAAESIIGLRKAIALLQPRKAYLLLGHKRWVNKAGEDAKKADCTLHRSSIGLSRDFSSSASENQCIRCTQNLLL